MVHDQQREMPDQKTRRVEHRIVSLHQPHVRPIVRGKAGHETEFGAKLTARLEDGYTRNRDYDFDSRPDPLETSGCKDYGIQHRNVL